MFLYKSRVRSSLVYIYNTTISYLIFFYGKIIKLNLEWGILPKPCALVILSLESKFGTHRYYSTRSSRTDSDVSQGNRFESVEELVEKYN